jgi:hypothetical protein
MRTPASKYFVRQLRRHPSVEGNYNKKIQKTEKNFIKTAISNRLPFKMLCRLK